MGESTPFLGRYELRSLLGRGGMGVVYEAVLHGPAGFRKLVALKLLAPHVVGSDSRAQADLTREARLGALVSHPNVVSTLELGEADGQWFVAMELVRGAPLARVLRSTTIPPAAVLEVGIQTCQALSHIHGLRIDGAPAGLVHRDVKLGNLLLDQSGLVKLCDLGIARVTSEAGVDVAGTLGWAAPEQLDGRAEPRSDLFSVGVALYLMATRRPPLPTESGHAVVATRGVEARLADPAFLRPVEQAVAGLGEVVRRCLRADPADRWRSADQLAAALRELVPQQRPGPRLVHLLGQVRPDLVSASTPPEVDSEHATVVLASRRALCRPPPTWGDRFFGRRDDLERLTAAFAGARLVTVVGPGGIGKSRLAAQLPADAEVAFCDLVRARSAEDVTAAVGAGIGVALTDNDPDAQLADALGQRGRLRLVLDGAEGAAAAVGAAVSAWLDAAPELTVLVTSRTPLHVGPEALLSLDPLEHDDAVALFLDRAPGPVPDAEAVHDLVRELDHLPLAIELAAARTRAMGPRALLDRLGDRFRVLTARRRDRPDRHTTLRASIDASWDLLPSWGQDALAQLSVFVDRFDLQLAEQVLDLAGHERAPWALDVLETLIDHSLVRYHRDDGRFTLLRSVRAYASERLDDEARASAERRHGEAFARLAASHPGLEAPPYGLLVRDLEAAALRALASDDLELAALVGQPAIRALLERGPVVRALELAEALLARVHHPAHRMALLREYSDVQHNVGRLGETRRAIEEAIAIAPTRGAEVALRITLATLGALDGDLRTAEEGLLACRDLAEMVGDPVQRVRVWRALGMVRHRLGRQAEALEALDIAAQLVRDHGSTTQLALVLNSRANARAVTGRPEAARQDYEQALVEIRKTGGLGKEAMILSNLAELDLVTGRPLLARRRMEEAVTVNRQLGARRGQAATLSTLGRTCLVLGDLAASQQALEEALQISDGIGLAQLACTIRAELGELMLHRGDLDRAERSCLEALAGARRLGRATVEGLAHLSLARIALERSDLQAAADHLAEADAHAPPGSPYERAAVELVGAQLALARGAPDAAERARAAARDLGELGDRVTQGMALAVAATAERAQGQSPEPWLDEARRALAETGVGPDSPLGRAVAALD